MGKWRPRFETMISQLQGNPQIVMETAVLRPPATEGQLMLLQPYAHTSMGVDLNLFYAEMNGLTVHWHLRNQAGIAGAIELWPVERVFGTQEGQPAYPDQIQGDTTFKPFDFFVPEACAALILPPNVPESMVYFHFFGERSIPTHRSFAQYLECLLQSRGYWYWIQTLSRQTAMNPEASQFLEAAPELFPDFDPRLFEPY